MGIRISFFDFCFAFCRHLLSNVIRTQQRNMTSILRKMSIRNKLSRQKETVIFTLLIVIKSESFFKDFLELHTVSTQLHISTKRLRLSRMGEWSPPQLPRSTESPALLGLINIVCTDMFGTRLLYLVLDSLALYNRMDHETRFCWFSSGFQSLGYRMLSYIDMMTWHLA